MAITAANRRLVLRRAQGRCEYCQIDSWPLTIDHVVPVAAFEAAGPGAPGAPVPALSLDHPDNLCAACWLCNRAKWDATGAADPLTGSAQRLFNPRADQWDEHFAWRADHSIITGRTAVGRATVSLLRLNRSIYRRQRRLLRAALRGGGPTWP